MEDRSGGDWLPGALVVSVAAARVARSDVVIGDARVHIVYGSNMKAMMGNDDSIVDGV